MINILLVDDDDLFSQGITALFNRESDMNVIGTAATVTDIREVEEDPDVILLNTEANEESIKTYVHQNFPVNKFFYILSFVDKKKVIQAMKAGVTGFVLNHIDSKRLVAAIRDFYYKQYIISGDIAEILMDELVIRQYSEKEIMHQKLKEKGITVTNRDLSILHLLYHQKTNKEITDVLGIAEKSVRDYVSTVYKHLQIHNRKGLYKFLMEIMDTYEDV